MLIQLNVGAWPLKLVSRVLLMYASKHSRDLII